MQSIFSGVSTSAGVTQISGRGLSIVKQKVEAMNGTIQVASQEGARTKFIIRIPLTLAVIFVLLVKQDENTYAIPLNSIERLITVPLEDIKGLLGEDDIIYNNTNIPLLHLSKLFSENKPLKVDRVSVVILRKDGSLLGLLVDGLLTTEEIITQPINTVIKSSKLFSGTALLGSGEMILILDIEQLFIASIGLNRELEKG